MQWDLGLRGVALLLAMSVGIGLLAQVVAGRATTRLLWLITAVVYFISGVIVSEVWFGWATQSDLQPNIDGLSFDEVLLIGVVPVIATVLVARYLARRADHASIDEVVDHDRDVLPGEEAHRADHGHADDHDPRRASNAALRARS